MGQGETRLCGKPATEKTEIVVGEDEEELFREPDDPMEGVYYRLAIVGVALFVSLIIYIALVIALRTNWCKDKVDEQEI